MNLIQIETEALSPWSALQAFEREHLHGQTNIGATANFVGTMRDFNEGDSVNAMQLEHYPEMTRRQLAQLVDQAYEQWPLLHSLLIHRVGVIMPGDPIVLVAVWTAHRKAAFEACRSIMESLKSTAPFWKKEILSDGSHRWVEKNTPG